jgi:hypothetical protein
MGFSNIPTGLRAPDNQVFEFVQSTVEGTLAQTNPAFANAAFNFSLNQLDQATSWEAVFDQYRLAEVEVTLRPQYNIGSATIGAVNYYSVIDYDDSNPVTSAAGMREYSNCMISGYETQVRRFTPHAAISAYQGAFTGFANVTAPWLDVASPTVQHYGLKIGIDPGAFAPTTPQTLIIQIRYRIQFRNVR